MKKMVLALVGVAFLAQAGAESLSTMDGVTYDNITAKRADPDGLYIEYTPAGGGIGMSKIKFSRLSADQQKQFGYDATKARDYENREAKAMDDWRQDLIRQEQVAKTERQAEEAREDRQDQASTERMVAMAQLTEAQADLARAQNGADYGSYGGGGYGAIAVPEVDEERGFENGKRGFGNREFDSANPAIGIGFNFGEGFGFHGQRDFRHVRLHETPNPLPPGSFVPFAHGRTAGRR